MTLDVVVDTSEQTEDELIQAQLKTTVQDFPDAPKGQGVVSWGSFDVYQRKSLLTPRGTTDRLHRQRKWYYHEANSMFRNIISGLTKRLQSLPYEIKSPDKYGDLWDDFVRYANFSEWEKFLEQLIVNYSIYDTGAFIEIIAPGNPQKAPSGAATGIAILDSRRCWTTGDPTYPVVYVSTLGKKHLLHRGRVVQFVDMGEKNDDLPGWGDSALSRCITPIYREILMSEYMRASLDDMPAPGFAIAKNLSETQILDRIRAMKERRENDDDIFGEVVLIAGMATEITPELNFITFQKDFTGYDPDKLAAMNAKYMAGGVGVDLQDFWELTGQGIGTATQSEILNEKSKGRALGRLIKGIERVINDVFPDDVEFAFKYRNEEEDLQRAQTAQTWAGAIQTMSDIITPDETRIILANQIDAVKDAITDDDGNVLRWNDADPQSMLQAADTNGIAIEGVVPIGSAPVSNGDSAETRNKLVIDQMKLGMMDVFTAAQLLGNPKPADELRGMFWVGNQLVPQNQLQNIWKYGTLIAPSTTNADLIVDSEPEVLEIDESQPSLPGQAVPKPLLQPDQNPATVSEDETPQENFNATEEKVLKAFRDNSRIFKQEFSSILFRLSDDKISPGVAKTFIMAALRRSGEKVYLDGARRAGVRNPKFNEDARKIRDRWLTQQRGFVDDFVDRIEGKEFTKSQIDSKSEQWSNGSLETMLYKGMEVVATKLWKWKVNFSKSNCRSCLALHNQVHTMSAFKASGLLPKSNKLICGHGKHCGCGLFDAGKDAKPRGRLSAVPTS